MILEIPTILLGAILAIQVAFAIVWILTRRKVNPEEAARPVVEELRSAERRSEEALERELAKGRVDGSRQSRELREEVGQRIDALRDATDKSARDMRTEVSEQLEKFRTSLSEMSQTQEKRLEKVRETLDLKVKELQESNEQKFDAMRMGTGEQLEKFRTNLSEISQSQDKRLEKVRETLDVKVKELQESNAQKLDEMRKTVDEKLHGALEKRLGESFKQVSERLEVVHKGLGEMQSLANGVGDLKRLMSNVKTRGTWGEMQLGSLLENFLAPDQFASNVETLPGSGERVEFAIQLPGQDSHRGPVWLPVDAKFPQEDYQRLLEAEESGDALALEQARRGLERAVRISAKDIARKYVNPPHTTDFAILFVPVESLYAELLRRPGLANSIQQELKVTLSGPTTFSALLNSLQMGFRTLAIQKRTSEVWEVLGAVKSEFHKFGGVLDKVQKKLHEANNVMEDAKKRSRVMQRKLKDVEALPERRAGELLGVEEPAVVDAEPEAPKKERAVAGTLW
ncbi:MAG: DNA recombination protein RmuC [Acidobacteria bacterium]|nr:DNA recombination protein RmuC [Acidobacteriota bacterium]